MNTTSPKDRNRKLKKLSLLKAEVMNNTIAGKNEKKDGEEKENEIVIYLEPFNGNYEKRFPFPRRI